MENNLPKTEFDAPKSLIKDKELIIKKADNGITVVSLNRKDYISKMKLILADTSKFKKTQIDEIVKNFSGFKFPLKFLRDLRDGEITLEKAKKRV